MQTCAATCSLCAMSASLLKLSRHGPCIGITSSIKVYIYIYALVYKCIRKSIYSRINEFYIIIVLLALYFLSLVLSIYLGDSASTRSIIYTITNAYPDSQVLLASLFLLQHWSISINGALKVSMNCSRRSRSISCFDSSASRCVVVACSGSMSRGHKKNNKDWLRLYLWRSCSACAHGHVL